MKGTNDYFMVYRIHYKDNKLDNYGILDLEFSSKEVAENYKKYLETFSKKRYSFEILGNAIYY